MSDFAKKNLNCNDYPALNAEWECQLKQLGYQRGYDVDMGYGWQSADDAPVQSAYDAWRTATNAPDDMRLGMEKESA